MIDALGRPGSVLVLGGGSEIGLAIARHLVERGARQVVLAGRDLGAMSAAAQPLRDAGAEVATVAFDAADVAGHEALVGSAFEAFGDFDVVVMAFAVLGDQQAYEADPGAAGRAAITNYAGAVSAGLAVASRLQRQGHGALVALSSVAGQRARRDNFVYGSAKAGLDAFATGLREALRGSGAQVLVVRPGFVRTKMTAGMRPTPFACDAGDVARAVVRGLDRGSSVVWVPGMLRWMFVVLRLLPQPIFRLLRR